MARERTTAINNHEQYKQAFDERGVKKIEQLRTPKFSEYPSNINAVDYTWKQGDSYWRLAYEFYGSSKYWYIIARFNDKPTEAHISIGEKILIPIDIKPLLRRA